MRLARRYGTERVEAACESAEHLGSCRYRTVKSILSAAEEEAAAEGWNYRYMMRLPAPEWGGVPFASSASASALGPRLSTLRLQRLDGCQIVEFSSA